MFKAIHGGTWLRWVDNVTAPDNAFTNMAYLVKRGGIFHLSHCVTPNGKWTRISTGLKIDQGKDVRAAAELEAEYTLKERQVSSAPARFRANEKWDAWLPDYIAMKFRNKPGTHKRYTYMLRTLRMFFTQNGIDTPRQLTRQHCFDYFKWRADADVKKGKFKAVHNTALLEVNALGTIMKEAVHRGFAPFNPCRELGIGRDEEKKPMEFSDDDLANLEKFIEDEPEPHRTVLWRSYIVAAKHGVRLMETNVNPMRDVNLSEDCDFGEITFYQKGGRKRVKPLHPDLLSLFANLRAEGATELFQMPPSFGAYWHRFFNKWKFRSEERKACFHSLRDTVQNRLRRAYVNDEIRRAYLSHEKKDDIHEGYSRIKTDELRVCHTYL